DRVRVPGRAGGGGGGLRRGGLAVRRQAAAVGVGPDDRRPGCHLANRRHRRLRRLVDAGGGGGGPVRLHRHRLAPGRRPRRPRRPGQLPGARPAGRGRRPAANPSLPPPSWLAFVDLFRTPVLWHDVSRGFAVQAVYIAVFLGAAWANFATKHTKSSPRRAGPGPRGRWPRGTGPRLWPRRPPARRRRPGGRGRPW